MVHPFAAVRDTLSLFSLRGNHVSKLGSKNVTIQRCGLEPKMAQQHHAHPFATPRAGRKKNSPEHTDAFTLCLSALLNYFPVFSVHSVQALRE